MKIKKKERKARGKACDACQREKTQGRKGEVKKRERKKKRGKRNMMKETEVVC